MVRRPAVVIGLLTALLGSGCMRQPAPLALASNDLDSMAYGRTAAASAAPDQAMAYAGGYRPAPAAYYPAPPEAEYRLDAGDRLRIVVYGQDGLSNSYAVGPSGTITLPLIGAVPARGLTPAELSRAIAARLRNGFIRDPYVACEIEAYRPFFILGEVAAPGQYPYVPNMTVEAAVAIAGGFSPRARRDVVDLTRSNSSGVLRTTVPLGTPIGPGDSIVVGERWF